MALKNHKTAFGAGLAALAAGAAAVYFLAGERNAKNRKKLKGWTVKFKGEVLERMEDMKDVNEKIYRKTVDEVMKMYRAAKNVDPKELEKLGTELKGHWRRISKDLQTGAKKVTKKVKKK